jgi:cytochrome P450
MFGASTTGRKLGEAFRPLFGYLHALVAAKRSEPGEDALSRIVQRSDEADHAFTDTELTMMAIALLIAGYDTTASMISYGLLMLLERPDELNRLRREPELAADASEELVRHLAVGVGTLREVIRDTEIAGQPIAAGEYVVVAIQTANRDSELSSDADRLDIGRKPLTHLGFGYGPHQCLGRQLARLELTTVLQTLPRRIPSLRLAVPLAQIEFKDLNLALGPASLPVSWDGVLPVRA